MEIWKQVKGYEGIYEVSSLGRVQTSLNKTTHSVTRGTRVWKQRVLKQKTDKNGYKRVSLWKDKNQNTLLVHRLVAIAFIDNPEEKGFVNHKDGDPSNNCVSNIEWCTSKENLLHAFDTRLNKSPDPIILYNLSNGEFRYFRSKSDAGVFLGRSKSFVSGIMKKGKRIVDGYEIYHNS
jgi:NUMOD4 motif/HNH endonuclease